MSHILLRLGYKIEVEDIDISLDDNPRIIQARKVRTPPHMGCFILNFDWRNEHDAYAQVKIMFETELKSRIRTTIFGIE